MGDPAGIQCAIGKIICCFKTFREFLGAFSRVNLELTQFALALGLPSITGTPELLWPVSKADEHIH